MNKYIIQMIIVLGIALTLVVLVVIDHVKNEKTIKKSAQREINKKHN